MVQSIGSADQRGSLGWQETASGEWGASEALKMDAIAAGEEREKSMAMRERLTLIHRLPSLVKLNSRIGIYLDYLATIHDGY